MASNLVGENKIEIAGTTAGPAGDVASVASLETSPAVLLRKFLEAKEQEIQATQKRVEAGNALALLLGAPEEGSRTHEVGTFKVTVKQPVNRKVDWKVLDEILVTDVPLPVVTKRELDVKGLHWIQKNRPEFYKEIARAITATPGRVSIEIKEDK